MMRKLAIGALFISQTVFSAEKSLYEFNWLDPDKEIYVLQGRKFRKAKTLTLGIHGGITTSGAFTEGNLFQGRGSYFFNEEMGFEVTYSKNQSKTNDVYDNVKKSAGVATHVRKISDYQLLSFVWSPFYAKVNTFNKIAYFDWLVSLGYARINDENNKNDILVTNTGTPNFESETHNGYSWATGLKFYLSQSYSVRVDYTALYYKADRQVSATEKTSDSYSNYDLTLGLSYSF